MVKRVVFVIKQVEIIDDSYYAGTSWTSQINEAKKFDTQTDAIKEMDAPNWNFTGKVHIEKIFLTEKAIPR